jgi:histidinol-phosphate aminotransferase
MLPKIRANVLAMKPYVPGKPVDEVKRELGLTDVVKLASNENPFGPSPKAIEAVKRAAETMHVYPDGAAFELKNKIAAKFGVPGEKIMVGNGSDELIHLLGHLFLDSPEDEVVVGIPGFVRYHASAHLAPCKLLKIDLDADYRHDIQGIIAAVNERTKIVYLDTPNNPTGTYVPEDQVLHLIRSVPEHVVVVLDEAYYEFVAHRPDYHDGLSLVKAHPNVVVLRTMSKAHGLAGLRLGYGFASAEIVQAMDRAREPFNVNSLAMVAGIAALDDDEHVRLTVENNSRGLQAMSEVFRQFGATPCESFANFLFVDLGRPCRPIYEALLREGVIVRPGDLLGNPNCMRVSIGTPAETDRFVSAFRAVMTPAGVTR